MMTGIKKLTVLLTTALFAAACQTTEHQAPKPEDDASESQSWETVYYMCEALESPMEHPACNGGCYGHVSGVGFGGNLP